ncbi:MAG: translesion error-prone DNA polymerase V autoproteolytic subunit [Parachlamydia sp.]|nr:translesion error-prone DNA polymerase V autoproteolytic subunit [Parachlamydia sp.]
MKIFLASADLSCPLPIFSSSVQAGFPSPADDYIENNLDLNELVIQRPAATFYVRVQGDSMQNAGIFSGDILVVDRSLKAKNNSIIVAIVNGEFTVKRLVLQKDGIYLFAENPRYLPQHLSPDSQFEVWGVVTYVIHKTT